VKVDEGTSGSRISGEHATKAGGNAQKKRDGLAEEVPRGCERKTDRERECAYDPDRAMLRCGLLEPVPDVLHHLLAQLDDSRDGRLLELRKTFGKLIERLLAFSIATKKKLDLRVRAGSRAYRHDRRRGSAHLDRPCRGDVNDTRRPRM
jgi:hypothetical protein